MGGALVGCVKQTALLRLDAHVEVLLRAREVEADVRAVEEVSAEMTRRTVRLSEVNVCLFKGKLVVTNSVEYLARLVNAFISVGRDVSELSRRNAMAV